MPTKSHSSFRQGDFYNYTNGEWIYRVVPDTHRAVRVSYHPRSSESLTTSRWRAGLAPGDEVVTTGYAKYGDAEEITW